MAWRNSILSICNLTTGRFLSVETVSTRDTYGTKLSLFPLIVIPLPLGPH